MQRCEWAGVDPIYIDYHDNIWGVPVSDDRLLFEYLILEGAQAGLSWITILKRRAAYKKVFAQFDPAKVAKFNQRKVEVLMADAGIIRNRLKIKSTINNARMFLKVQKEYGSFKNYQWQFVKNKPIQNRWASLKDLPAKTAISETFSKDLKNRGFNFVGPTIIYAHMQAVGMVNDHTTNCFCYKKIKKLGTHHIGQKL